MAGIGALDDLDARLAEAGTVTSERRKAANRANARYSTGPKTLKRKAAVRLNAVRHGLLGPDVLLPGEDGDAFDDLRSQMCALTETDE